MRKETIKWTTVAAAATALIGTAAFTAAAGAPVEAAANESVEAASYEAAEDADGSVIVAGEDGETMTFTVEDGVITDADGNVLGTVGDKPNSMFVLIDDEGNPVEVTVSTSASGGDGNSTVTYTVAESVSD